MTPQEQEKLMQNPRVKRLCQNGDKDSVEKMVSLAYLCFSLGNAFTERANEVLDKYGLVLHNVKYFSGRLEKAFDQYHAILRTMLPTIDNKKEFIREYSVFSELLDAMLADKINVRRGDYFAPTVYLPNRKEQPSS